MNSKSSGTGFIFFLTLLMTLALTNRDGLAGEKSKLTYEMAPGSGSVESFVPTKPKLFVVHGKGESPRGVFVIEKGKVTGLARFRLDTLDTGINLRNTHLREKYLHTKQYPEAELEINGLALPDAFFQPQATVDLPFEGTLNLHGVKKKINGQARFERKDSKLRLHTEFMVRLPDFNIETPGFAGVQVAEEVRVVVESEGGLQ